MKKIDLSFIDSNILAAGVDEAGRGPLAGPVVAAAVIFPLNFCLSKMGLQELDDSKKLKESTRQRLFPIIKQSALAWAVAWADRKEIDSVNILQATMLAMHRSLLRLDIRAGQVLVDGNKLPALPDNWTNASAHAIVKGDQLVPAISAASVLAKVTRDNMLVEMHKKYPEYGFEQHKGYPTKVHLAMLSKYGPCPHHRRSFAPVRNCLTVT